MAFTIFDADDIGLISSVSPEYSVNARDPCLTLKVCMPTNMLNNGFYRIEGAILDEGGPVDQVDQLISFNVIRTTSFDLKYPSSKGLVRVEADWMRCSGSQLTKRDHVLGNIC
jgi:hypothetical protein